MSTTHASGVIWLNVMSHDFCDIVCWTGCMVIFYRILTFINQDCCRKIEWIKIFAYTISLMYYFVMFLEAQPSSPSSELDDELLEEPEVPEQIALAPSGIPFFKNSMYCLYTEGNCLVCCLDVDCLWVVCVARNRLE